MILLDANLLLYAHNATSREHGQAEAWIRNRLSDPEMIGLTWDTILAFLRVATAPRVFSNPFELDTAISIIDKWLALPNVVTVFPTQRHWQIFRQLLPQTRARASLFMDAHLAALAIEHGATLCTNDRDFARFPGLKVEFPIQ